MEQRAWIPGVAALLALGCHTTPEHTDVVEDLLRRSTPLGGRILEVPQVASFGAGVCASWSVSPVPNSNPSWGWMVSRTRGFEVTHVSKDRFHMVQLDRHNAYYVQMNRDRDGDEVHVFLTVMPR